MPAEPTLHHYTDKMIAREFPKHPLGLVTTTPEDHLARLESLSQVTRHRQNSRMALKTPGPQCIKTISRVLFHIDSFDPSIARTGSGPDIDLS